MAPEHTYYRMRTPGGVGVSARLYRERGDVYLAVGQPVRVALMREEAWATVAVLLAALSVADESAPQWASVEIQPTTADGKPVDGA